MASLNLWFNAKHKRQMRERAAAAGKVRAERVLKSETQRADKNEQPETAPKGFPDQHPKVR